MFSFSERGVFFGAPGRGDLFSGVIYIIGIISSLKPILFLHWKYSATWDTIHLPF